MARITWQNVDAPDLSQAINARAQAAQLLQAASQGVQDLAQTNIDRIKDKNTNQVLNQILTSEDPSKVQIDPALLNDLNPEAFDYVTQMLSSKNAAKNTELQGQNLDLERQRLAADLSNDQLERDKLAQKEKEALEVERILAGAGGGVAPTQGGGLSSGGLGALGITGGNPTVGPLFEGKPTIDIPAAPAPEGGGMLGVNNPGNNTELLNPDAPKEDPLLIGIGEGATDKYFKQQEEVKGQQKALEARQAQLATAAQRPGLSADSLKAIRLESERVNEDIRRLGVEGLNLAESASQANKGAAAHQGAIIADNTLKQFATIAEADKELARREKEAPADEKIMWRAARESLAANEGAFTPAPEAVAAEIESNDKLSGANDIVSAKIGEAGAFGETAFGITGSSAKLYNELSGLGTNELMAKIAEVGGTNKYSGEQIAAMQKMYQHHVKRWGDTVPPAMVAAIVMETVPDVDYANFNFGDTNWNVGFESDIENRLEKVAGSGWLNSDNKETVQKRIREAAETSRDSQAATKSLQDTQMQIQTIATQMAHAKRVGNMELYDKLESKVDDLLESIK